MKNHLKKIERMEWGYQASLERGNMEHARHIMTRLMEYVASEEGQTVKHFFWGCDETSRAMFEHMGEYLIERDGMVVIGGWDFCPAQVLKYIDPSLYSDMALEKLYDIIDEGGQAVKIEGYPYYIPAVLEKIKRYKEDLQYWIKEDLRKKEEGKA